MNEQKPCDCKCHTRPGIFYCRACDMANCPYIAPKRQRPYVIDTAALRNADRKLSLVEVVVSVLNRLLEADHDAAFKLLTGRVTCNDAVVNDPTIICDEQDGKSIVGPLGLINGILLELGCPMVVTMGVDIEETAIVTPFGITEFKPIAENKPDEMER